MRIPPSRLEAVNTALFGTGQTNGPKVASALRTKHVTLWSWINRRGLPMEAADKLATELERRAAMLLKVSAGLRREMKNARRVEVSGG